MTTSSEQRNRFRAPATIFWVALALRLAVILIGHTYRIRTDLDHFNYGWEMGRIARSLVQGHGFGNPFNGISGPTAWTPPLFPLLVALAFRLFGTYSNAAALFILAVNSVFSAAISPAVFEIAARCFDARGIARCTGRFFGRVTTQPVALWAGWLWAVYPAALQYAIHWIWEMSLSAMLFTWIVVFALRLRGIGEPDRQGAKTPLRWLAFGALWGLLNLSNASLLLCLPAMLLWIAWPELCRNAAVLKRSVAGAFLACVALCAVMSPWWVRNERVLHAFVPTRSNFGFELYESTMYRNDGFPWGGTLSLWPGDPEFQHYIRVGEIQMGRERGAAAKARMKQMPGQILRWDVQRFFFFWDGEPHPLDRHPASEYGRQLSYAFLSASGLLGLALMLHRRIEGAGLFAFVFLLLPLPYYLITVQARFRHPMEPLITVLAVFLFRSTEKRIKA